MNSIPHALRAALEKHSDVSFTDSTGTISFAQLDAIAAQIATAMIANKLAVGDRVAIALPNSRWAAASYLAIWKAGGIVVAINPALTEREIAHILANSKPAMAIGDSKTLTACRNANAKAGAPVRCWMTSGTTEEGQDTLSLSELAPVQDRWPDRPGPDVGALLYTSGTTGVPKGVMLTHENMLFAQAGYRDSAGLTREDATLIGVPLFHCYGLIPLFLESLLTGHAVVLEAGFPIPKILRTLSEHRITMFPAIPPVYHAIASLNWNEEDYDFSSLRLITSAAAPMAPKVINRARQRLGNPAFYDAYGITETATLISMGPLSAPNPSGSSGKPAKGVQIEIRDGANAAVAVGEAGQIWVASAGVMKGYNDNPEATAEVLVDGWYATGDVGYLDADGYLYVSGRIKDMIIVSGENVYPTEVEAALLEHPDISDAAVVGMPAEDTGEVPRAYLVTCDGNRISTPALLKFLRERLAAFKIPRHFDYVTELPVSESGKILRRELSAGD